MEYFKVVIAITSIEKTMAIHGKWWVEGTVENTCIIFLKLLSPPFLPSFSPFSLSPSHSSEAYWRCLHHTANLLHVTHAAAESRDGEEADTVTALASLSMTGNR